MNPPDRSTTPSLPPFDLKQDAAPARSEQLRAQAGSILRTRSERQRRWARSLAGLLWLSAALVPVLTACSAEYGQVRKAARQEEFLQECAKSYWHALRWGYYEQALPFVVAGKTQQALSEYLENRKKEVSILDYQIYRVELDPDTIHARVFVSYQLLGTSSATVREKKATQHWYYSAARWYLSMSDDELKRLDLPPED